MACGFRLSCSLQYLLIKFFTSSKTYLLQWLYRKAIMLPWKRLRFTRRQLQLDTLLKQDVKQIAISTVFDVILVKQFTDQIWEMKSHKESRKLRFSFFIFVCKTKPPFARKFRSICMKNQKYDFLLLSKPVPFKFDWQHLLLGFFASYFTEIEECQPPPNYRSSNSRLFPYI